MQSKRSVYRALFGECLVLLYHRVTNLPSDPQLLAVRPENFDAQMELLASEYKVLSADQFSWHLNQRKKFPKKAVLITFDDGYADNYLEAMPILEKHNLHALFYIATGFIGTKKEYWWDEVERLILLRKDFKTPSTWKVASDLYNEQKPDAYSFYDFVLNALRKLPFADREIELRKIEALGEVSIARETHRAMTWDELALFAQSPAVSIGAHTAWHPSLGQMSAEVQREEITTSKHMLESALVKPIVHFSYPFGTGADFNAESIRICDELRFETVAANYPSPVHANSNRFTFPRYLVRDWNVRVFEEKMNHFARQ